MASQVRYKFAEMKTWDAIAFEGNTISVLDIKRAIVIQKKLDKTAGDFDLSVKDAQSGEVFNQDAYLVPKNTSLIVKRIPATKAKSIRIIGNPSADVIAVSSVSTDEERAAVQIMQQAVVQSSVRPVVSGVASSFNASQAVFGSHSENKPPPTYICHKCNQPGHWIKFCPNVPTDGSDIKTFKQGAHFLALPRFFLKDVERPTEKPAISAMGGNKYDPFENQPQLKCQICRRPFRNATTTPCCYTKYCNECLRQELSSNLNNCPMCRHPLAIDSCHPNPQLQAMVDQIAKENNFDIHAVRNEQTQPLSVNQSFQGTIPPSASVNVNPNLARASGQPVLPANYPPLEGIAASLENPPLANANVTSTLSTMHKANDVVDHRIQPPSILADPNKSSERRTRSPLAEKRSDRRSSDHRRSDSRDNYSSRHPVSRDRYDRSRRYEYSLRGT